MRRELRRYRHWFAEGGPHTHAGRQQIDVSGRRADVYFAVSLAVGASLLAGGFAAVLAAVGA